MKESKTYKAMVRILYPLVRLIYHPKVYFEDKESQKAFLKEPSILVCNHIAHVDGTVISYIFQPQPIHHLAAKDRFEQNAFLRWYLSNAGCIPIDRKTVSTDWIHTSIKTLKIDKESIAIYPEGRHGKNHEILPFHSGVTMIAAMAQTPIVLLYNNGPYSLTKRCEMLISKPFMLEPPTDGLTSDYVQAQTDLLHEKMIELQQKFYELKNQK
ncbi:MAG: 1-acyl-sn-glycerol-3-phosphate acyltransferase [Bacteroidales bacterium]|nr:1-acyl-sn-glycerol-3-phosphate acyltransferase [Bacteroidales bacterium]